MECPIACRAITEKCPDGFAQSKSDFNIFQHILIEDETNCKPPKVESWNPNHSGHPFQCLQPFFHFSPLDVHHISTIPPLAFKASAKPAQRGASGPTKTKATFFSSKKQ
jgi:hypothetical protein